MYKLGFRRNNLAIARRLVLALMVGTMFFGLAAVSTVNAGQPQIPIAVDDNYSMVHDQTLTIDAGTGVLANDTLPNSQPPWHAELVSGPAGTLTLNPDGGFSYAPPTGFVGFASFIYELNNNAAQSADVSGAGAIAIATAYIEVINNLPVVADDAYSTEKDTVLSVAAPGVLANDSDPDGDPFEVFDIFTSPSHGTVTIQADGSFVYTPASGYVGIDTFEYEVVDNFLVAEGFQSSGIEKPIALVTITITEPSTPAPTETTPAEATSTVLPTDPTEEPSDPTAEAPTPTSGATGGVTDLPNTGAPLRGGDGPQNGVWIIAILLLSAGLVIRRTKRRAS